MTRFDAEAPCFPQGRQRRVKIFRQCVVPRLEEAGGEESGEVACAVETALAPERLACRQQSLEKVHMGILPARFSQTRDGCRNAFTITAAGVDELFRDIVQERR